MPSDPVDPRWPKLLSLTVHEFRTPMTVVAGYIRMVLKERAGPISDQQRRLLEEAEKSCGRLSALMAEVSDLSAFEAGTITFNRSALDVRVILIEIVRDLPTSSDRPIQVDVSTAGGPAIIDGDAVRLRQAFKSILVALGRELVTSDRLVVREQVRRDGGLASWIVVAGSDRIDELVGDAFELHRLTTFDEWRGGCGLSLALARRIIDVHGGGIWSLESEKGAAVIRLPHAGQVS
jgi:signal transduction histidine kinase